MATSKPDRLADLTASLAARKATSTSPMPFESSPVPPSLPEQLVQPERRAGGSVPTQSISFYESDLDLVEEVRHWLAQRGLRGCNTSEAVRVCLRFAVQADNADALAQLCRAARDVDGRKTRWVRGRE